MADVFLSYASGDRGVAQRLAHAIGESGLSVWWDRHIKGGAEFSRDIERELEQAAKVLVLWSKEAVGSRWVRDEASVAADSGRLVSATIDGTSPPLGFRQFQTIDLRGWAAKGAAIPVELAEALEVEAPVDAAGGAPRPRRRLIAAAAGALMLGGAVTIAIVQPAPFDRIFSGDREDAPVSLAIMPFTSEAGAGKDFIGAGLARALSDSLAPLSGLKLTASTSAKAIAGAGLTASQIGNRLKVTHLVEGDVEQSGEHYGISVRLVDARSSEQIWARTFEGKAGDLQTMKGRMARELAGALRARLGVGEGAVAERGNVDPRAYEAFLRALERLSVRDERGARLEAIKQFRLAATIEPGFADAHAGHAYLLSLSLPHQLGISWAELRAEQQRAATRALELDPKNVWAMTSRSTALKNMDGEVDRAIAIDREVLKRAPNFGPAHYSMAASLWMMGRGREALHHLDLAIERDPFDTLLRAYRAKILYSLGDHDGVRDTAQNCPEPCAGISFTWLLALAGFGTEADFERDRPAIKARGSSNGVSAEDLAEGEAIVMGFMRGRSVRLRPLPDDRIVEFIDAVLDGRLISFELGMRHARFAAEHQHADDVLNILNDGRVTFTREQRADPRYHALFRHPKLARIAAVRRRQGVEAGLPVLPVKPYTGP